MLAQKIALETNEFRRIGGGEQISSAGASLKLGEVALSPWAPHRS
jgi:hypothetical protein